MNRIPNWVGPLLVVIIVFLVIAYIGGGSEDEWQKRDPEGYAKYMEEVRAEGVPDPRR